MISCLYCLPRIDAFIELLFDFTYFKLLFSFLVVFHLISIIPGRLCYSPLPCGSFS